jgi:hypothetical protein
MRSLGRLVLCVLLLAGPTGCISWFTDPMGYRNAFDQTQRQYTQHLRWGEVEKAGSFVDPALREAFLQQAPVFQNMRITDFSIGEVAFQDDSARSRSPTRATRWRRSSSARSARSRTGIATRTRAAGWCAATSGASPRYSDRRGNSRRRAANRTGERGWRPDAAF